MNSKDIADLRKKDVDELRSMLAERRGEMMTLRFSKATGALENTARLGEAKRDVARIMTIIGERTRTEATA